MTLRLVRHLRFHASAAGTLLAVGDPLETKRDLVSVANVPKSVPKAIENGPQAYA